MRLEDAGGVPYPVHAHRGASFVQVREGDRYRVRLTNRRAARVEVVLSVDGVDVVTGRPADPGRQRGYVLAPFGSIVVEGYRQSFDHVAAFRFVAPADGYAQAGPDEAGILAAAVFEERPSRTRGLAWTPAYPVHHAPAAESLVDEAPAAASPEAGDASSSPVVVTGWGETTVQSVHPVRFRRHHPRRPDAVVYLFYEAQTST